MYKNKYSTLSLKVWGYVQTWENMNSCLVKRMVVAVLSDVDVGLKWGSVEWEWGRPKHVSSSHRNPTWGSPSVPQVTLQLFVKGDEALYANVRPRCQWVSVHRGLGFTAWPATTANITSQLLRLSSTENTSQRIKSLWQLFVTTHVRAWRELSKNRQK